MPHYVSTALAALLTEGREGEVKARCAGLRLPIFYIYIDKEASWRFCPVTRHRALASDCSNIILKVKSGASVLTITI
jgi:hypothetical protein